MLKVMRLAFFAVIFMFSSTIFSQNMNQEFSFEEYLGYVKKFHPLVKSANLEILEMNRKRKPMEKIKFKKQLDGYTGEAYKGPTDNDIESKAKLIDMINCDEIHDDLEEFILKEKDRRKINLNLLKNINNQESKADKFLHLENTNYSQINAYTKFFNKYHQYEGIKKKGLELETPSFKFIQGIKEKRIVPNPVGLVKRSGNVEQVNIKYFILI